MFALFQSNPPSPHQTLNRWHGKAIVDEAILPYKIGRVRFRGSYWNARSIQSLTFLPEEVVEVLGIENLTLIVQPYTPCESAI